ncbi:ankyrin repeat-containing domain protein [Coniochaeta sp. 2T2.1]|nr:ankyrin repeat-containing domain protein [Coniochaeta sp. 2T2.1]
MTASKPRPQMGDTFTVCSSLATRARSGTQEIESFLSGRADAPEHQEFQQLRSLASKLQHLGRDAGILESKLRRNEEQPVSPELQRTLSAGVTVCNDAAGTITKQLMRLGTDTPREAIGVPTVLLYESAAEVAGRFMAFMTRVLDFDSVEVQEAEIQSRDARTVLDAVTFACDDIARSSGILLDTDNTAPTDHDLSDEKPPGYAPYGDAPPPFQDRSVPSESKHGGGGGSGNNNSSSFLSSLASPFLAATAALRSKPEPLVNALCQAAATGNLSQIRSLVAEGANINGRDDNGQTPLIRAVHANQPASIQTLLDSGADISRTSSGYLGGGRPPLFHAIALQNAPLASLLLAHSADPNQQDSWGQRYFLSLVIMGDTPAEPYISLLLAHGADPSAADASGQSPVTLAIRRRKRKEDRDDVVRLLLRHGADVNARDTDGAPLLHLCLQRKRRGLALELLAEGADANARDVSGITVLETVVKSGDVELAKAALEKGADPNVVDFYGNHLLFSVLGDAEKSALVALLLEHGARGDVRDLYGVTALERALSPVIRRKGVLSSPAAGVGGGGENELRIAELLLRKGADANQRLIEVPGKPTVLAYARERGLADFAALAVRYGAAG